MSEHLLAESATEPSIDQKKRPPSLFRGPINRNVRVAMLYTFFSSLGYGVWALSTLSAYVYRLTNNSNRDVGNLEAAQGAAQLIAAPICGVIADRFSRHKILKISAALNVVCVLGGIYVILVHQSYVLMYPVLCVYGFFSSFEGAAFEAIFADSLANDDRTYFYSWRQFFSETGSMFGPIVNVIMYVYLGDDWSLSVLQWVMVAGLALSGASGVFLLFFSDAHTLKEESEAVTEVTLITPHISARVEKYGYLVPWVMLLSAFIVMVGAGMTVKFFPIFFLDKFHAKPIVVNIAYIFAPLLTAILSLVFGRVTDSIGRVQTIAITFALSIGCLVVMALVKDLAILLPVFVLRGALANCAYPQERSVVMEFVPKNRRGKWSALESLLGTFWTGSASLGGYLIDRIGFDMVFIVTASIYAFSTLVMMPLVYVVPK